ncbi:MAG: hypothetical protein QXE10_01935 [Desulfurococcaceae archaeon]
MPIHPGLESPDEIYRDRFRVSVEYYSKKISEHYLCIVVVAGDAVTAYLINQEKY